MADENTSTFQNSTLPTRSYEFFRAVRKDAELCDITFCVGNRSIPAHRLVIAAAIPYFRNSFFTKETESEGNDFPDVDPSAFESIVDYAYTCKIVITAENVKSLLYVACRLDVEEVRKACCDFLISGLCPENVLNIQNIAADLKCTELSEMTDIYVKENFTDMSDTEEFLNLPLSYVSELLGCDELCLSSEEEVFETVMKWVKKCPEERKKNLPELLKLVRMPLLSLRYLRNHVAKEDLIRASLSCRDLLDEASDFHNFPEERSSCSFSTIPRCCFKTSNESTAVNKEHMYAIYCRQIYSAKYLEDPRAVWSDTGTAVSLQVSCSSAVVRDKLYLLRGHDVISYDPMSGTCKQCEIMPSGRYLAGAAELSNKIYVCGGRRDYSASDIVECYDPESEMWEKICNMLERRSQPGVATLDGCIYVSGGHNDNVIHRSVEKYETRDGRWRPVAPMLCERFGPGFTALDCKLYACGGKKSDFKCTASAEVYDPIKNKWSFIAPMKSYRYCFKLLPYCGELYAIGGLDNEFEHACTIEIYDPKADEWRFGDDVASEYFVTGEVVTSSSPTA